MQVRSALKANDAIGAMMLGIFGAVWLAAGCIVAVGRQPVALVGIAVGMVALCMAAVLRFHRNRAAYRDYIKTPAGKRASRAIGLINGVQWLSIAAALLLLPDSQRQWFIPVVMAIVGIHFIPLAVVLRYRPYHLAAFAMVIWAVAYPLLAPAGPASSMGPCGAGTILWLASLGQLIFDPSPERTVDDTSSPGA